MQNALTEKLAAQRQGANGRVDRGSLNNTSLNKEAEQYNCWYYNGYYAQLEREL